jgi:hypothetical protein
MSKKLLRHSSHLSHFDERVRLQRRWPVLVPLHLFRVDVPEQELGPHRRRPPRPPPRPLTVLLQRPPLQPHQLQLVEGEVQRVQAVEVLHGRVPSPGGIEAAAKGAEDATEREKNRLHVRSRYTYVLWKVNTENASAITLRMENKTVNASVNGP